jgi:hypothetical protein
MAAPAVVRSVGDNPSPNRVLVNVTNEREQMAIRGDEPRAIATFEQVTGSRDHSLPEPRIAACKQTHHVAERGGVDLQREVDVVRHPAMCVQASTVPFESIRGDALEGQKVIVALKNCLAVIAT